MTSFCSTFQYIDYSDDESERRAKAKRKNKKNQDDGEKNGENWEKKNKYENCAYP